MNKSSTFVVSSLTHCDKSISDPIKVANIFNNFFSNNAAKAK